MEDPLLCGRQFESLSPPFAANACVVVWNAMKLALVALAWASWAFACAWKIVVRSDAKSGVLARPWTPGPAPGGGCIRPTPPKAARTWGRGVDVLEELAGSLAFGPLSPAPPPAGSVRGGGGLRPAPVGAALGEFSRAKAKKKSFCSTYERKIEAKKTSQRTICPLSTMMANIHL